MAKLLGSWFVRSAVVGGVALAVWIAMMPTNVALTRNCAPDGTLNQIRAKLFGSRWHRSRRAVIQRRLQYFRYELPQQIAAAEREYEAMRQKIVDDATRNSKYTKAELEQSIEELKDVYDSLPAEAKEAVEAETEAQDMRKRADELAVEAGIKAETRWLANCERTLLTTP